MKRLGAGFLVGVLFGIVAVPSLALPMTIQLGAGGADLIVPGQIWRYLPGIEPPSDPPDAWKESGYAVASDTTSSTEQPGFEAVIAIVALLVVAYRVRREVFRK